MGKPVQLYGNIDLMALRGARVVMDEDGVEVLQIPIDIANLKRSGNHLYLGYFTFEKKVYNYDFMTVRSQTKEEREERKQTEVLGNAVFVKGYGNAASDNTGGGNESAPPPSHGKADDTPF